ncbi:hypothetical protein DW886_12650 [Enterocloster aldenensis]|nr:hypothetical protein DW886_12650 [Enterocloster aldenensis]
MKHLGDKMILRKLELFISYNGRNFYSFYPVYGMRTVQSELESVLSHVLNEKAVITAIQGIVPGCSVKVMPVYMETSSSMQTGDIVRLCNLELDKDIRLCYVHEVESGQTLLRRKSIKEYEYHFMNYPMPVAVQGLCGCLIRKKLDIEAMQEAAYLLIGENDFSSFTTGEYEDPYRTIFSAEVEKRGSSMTVRMSGTGFLMNMVQMLTGELIRIGKGEMAPEDILKRFALRCPDPDAPEMPAAGLILMRVAPIVHYEDIIHNNNEFADYYVIQHLLKTEGRVFIVMMRCEDQSFERLVKHVVRLSYMDQAREIYFTDLQGRRIRDGEKIGNYTPRSVPGGVDPEALMGIAAQGDWYLMEQ